MMIGQETIQRIRDAARIEEVVGEFVTLKKRGASFQACCPFHNEKTPSFHVNPARGIFKCFGCGEAGDSVSFLMKHEHYSYPEALRYLARKYHIEIDEEQPSEEERQRQSERDALFHLTEFAQQYFADILYNDEEGRSVGLSYLHSRGLTDGVIRKFGLGYCKDEWTDFTDHARRSGYSDEVLTKTGLTVFKEEAGRAYDRFRARVMFPIFSISGRVLGFSGRVLTSGKQSAKYVNSPESDIYTKGNSLYGLYQARQAISRQDKCYLVEGNVDVVSMFMSGVENTVASCGTALTTQQIRLIKRYTTHVTVLYDGDAAGIKATLKAVDLLFAEGMHVRMVLFPDGDDPDSYAQKYGSEQLQRYLAEHEENFLLYRMRVAGDEIRRDPIRKAELENAIVHSIALVPDPLERSEYVVQCASIFAVSDQTLTTLVAKAIARQRQQPSQAAPAVTTGPDGPSVVSETPSPIQDGASAPQQAAPVGEVSPQEHKLISLLVCHGHQSIPAGRVADLIVKDLEDDELQFDHPVLQRIFNLFQQALQAGQPLPDANFFARTDDTAMRNMALEMLMSGYTISPRWKDKHIYVPTPEERLAADVVESVLSFKARKVEQRMQSVDMQLKTCTDEEVMFQLLAEKNELKKLHIAIGHGALHRIIT
ncbi:MAG: DNA primase [bacterium P3]|nr:MAG: DNA primase [bacterium P3]KWW38980.1 MAG: DNA primase [bacterium F083]